jgi:23S rRNA pseudouridine2605 synthase
MGVATGFQVMRLSRVSFAGVTSEGLRPGQVRMLTFDELQSIKAAYGVPKRVRSPQALPEAKSREPRPSSRFARTHQPPPQDDRAPVRSKREDDRPPRDERTPARGRSAPRDERTGARSAPRGDAPRTGARPAAKKEGRHAPPAGRGRSTPLPSRKPRPESAETAGGRPAGRSRSAPAGRVRGEAPAGRGRGEAPSGGRGRSGSTEGRSGRGGGPPRGGRSGR